MRTTMLSITCGLALLTAGSAMAGSAGNSTDQQQRMAAADTQTVTCRAFYHEGMLLTRAKRCKTNAEWQNYRARAQEEVRREQMRSMFFKP